MARIWKSALVIAGLCAASLAPAQAAPVQYLKVCSLYGTGYFYIPGTDECVNANAINDTQRALSSFSEKAYTGVAISTAIAAPYMPTNANYAISVHWGGFEGSNAVGVGGLMRAGNSNFFLSGGVGTGVTGGAVAERAGFMFAW